jgi:hypothetical protein
VPETGASAPAPTKLSRMAEAVSRENLSARLADVRESLSLLADYL